MPLYRATIEKHSIVNGEHWRNVYLLLEASAADAIGDATAIAGWEADVSYDSVVWDDIRCVNIANKNDRRVYNPSGTLVGALSRTGLGGPLPLYVTVLVTFTDSIGRPERKYLRVGAQRDNLTAGVWDITW